MMNFEISLSNFFIGVITILLSITAYFLRDTLLSLKELQEKQQILATKVARIEGICSANHKEWDGPERRH
jgi:hypothetical protein